MTYSPTNVRSTIGADGLNFSVRNGKRWIPDAIDRLNKCTAHLLYTYRKKKNISFTSYFRKQPPFKPLAKEKQNTGCMLQRAATQENMPARKEKSSGN